MKPRSCGIAIIVFLCAGGAMLILCAGYAYLRFTGATSTGASARSANLVLWSDLRIPGAAADVTYRVDFWGCEAEFAITEEAFLKWCNQNGWYCEPISSPTPYFEPVQLPPDTRPVTRGYTFSLPDGQGTFDADRLRACFWVSTFP